MKLLFDCRYPVTSLLLPDNGSLSMFIQFGGDQTESAFYYSGGIIGEVVKVDPSQLWRIVTATFVHIGLEHFVLNMITLLLGTLTEDSLVPRLISLSLIRHDGQYLCCYFLRQM